MSIKQQLKHDYECLETVLTHIDNIETFITEDKNSEVCDLVYSAYISLIKAKIKLQKASNLVTTSK